MEHYEVLCIFPGKFTEEEAANIRGKITELVKKLKGEITFENSLGFRRLAYPIHHERQGHYLAIEFNAESTSMHEIDRQLRLEPTVLRHLIIKKHEKTEEERVREQAMAEKFKVKQAERLERTKEKEAKSAPAPAETVTEPAPSPARAPAAEGTAPEEAQKKTPEAPATRPVKKPEEKKEEVSLDELDRKLDEILEDSDIKL